MNDHDPSPIQDLDPLSMPLDGISLIEASAGTGKTFSITRLYLRLLLERELPVEKILVVTFTKAATEELRGRIRAAIDAARRILADSAGGDADPELRQWLEERADAGDEQRLRLALASMDGAAVFTIHGFCQRVLTDHAFDTRMAFDLEFLDDEVALRRQAVEDFWRRRVADSHWTPPLLQRVLAQYPEPGAILQRIGPRLADPLALRPEVPGVDELAEEITAQSSAWMAIHEELRGVWREEGTEVARLLRESTALNRRIYNRGAVDKALAAVEVLCLSDWPLFEPGEKFELLSQKWMREKTKKGCHPPSHRLFSLCADYCEVLAKLEPLLVRFDAAFLQQARQWVREHLAGAKQRANQLYFDDLLQRLDDALAGDGGEVLAQRLRQQYPVAMIDEFQDTDAVQYRIFRAIYGRRAEGCGLCLIGDPKQAIYGFRGGDVFTYLAAAREADRRYSLATNWRASTALVEAVNTLFTRSADAFRQRGIDYRPVEASPRADAEPLRIDGGEPVPMQFWRLPSPELGTALQVDDARANAAAACADHIAMLLRPGGATIGERPLRAADIAILLRTHRDVGVVQQALRERGIGSVSLAETSVFATDEARALRGLLQAVIHCEDEGLLRYALADGLLARPAGEIAALLADDDAWDAVQRRFFDYREIWRNRGFIQAFTRLFRDEGIAARLLATVAGERRLTNLLQLVELLQQASRLRPGLEVLLHWLDERIAGGDSADEAKLRLESDEGLVRIVTMHASKGLEYPVVYLPFPWSGRPADAKPPLFCHDDAGEPLLHFGGDGVEQAWRRVVAESTAEAIRLFYVAVTRAAKLCVMTWGKVNRMEHSALAWLLGVDAKAEEAEIFAPLEALASQAPTAIALCDPPESARLVTSSTATAAPLLEPRVFAGSIQRHWRVNSYSGLIRGGGGADRPDYDHGVSGAAAVAADDPVQALPAGADFGLLVHQTLERLDFTAASPEVIGQCIERLSWRYGLAALRQPQARAAATEMISRVLDTRLPVAGLRLRDLPRGRRIDELEFHFATDTLSPARLQRLLQPFPDWREAAEGLRFSAFEGLLHGYIDLVFERDGRYWLADYKSNRLDDYGGTALAAAMAAHHYPLQALIYALALHRHLRQRLPDYEPARHFGGVFYLFTRGMRPGGEAGIWFRPIDGKLLDALDIGFGGRVAA